MNNASHFILCDGARARRSEGQPTASHRSWIFKLGLVPAFLWLGAAGGRASAQAPQPADAVLPAGLSLNWEQVTNEPVNAKRTQASLDGIWRFIPAAPGATEPPPAGWGFIRVPGSWGGGAVARRGGGNFSRGGSSALVVRGAGPPWVNYDGSQVQRAWFERQVPIPADWRGRGISLRFDRVSTDAIIQVNGMECGRVSWPWGAVDITGAVTSGQTANVRLLVAAISDSGMIGQFGQDAFRDVTDPEPQLRTRGLVGNVYLESRASDPQVTDVLVRISTRRKSVSLDVELTGVKQSGPVHLVADMLDEKGRVEKSFTAEAVVAAQETQTVTVSWPWTNPRLWDVEQPNLYTLRLKVTGAGIDDEYDQLFGFREFWSEGRQFYLNGTVIHLRQPGFTQGDFPQVGDNFSEFGTWNVDSRGDASDAGPQLDRADHIGYLAAVFVLDAKKYIVDSSSRVIWNQDRPRALERAAVWMRHYHNHPSAVMWIAGRNFFMNAVNLDPRHVGRRGWVKNDPHWQQLMVAADEMFAELKQLDPTRVYFSHEGTYTGDAYSMNCYLDFIPLQEREDWLSAWAKSGEMPITMTEFGTPMDCTFLRGRDGFESNITSEPLLTEYAAIYFGSDAYAAEGPNYRQYLHNLFRNGMLYNSSQDRLDQFADMRKIQVLFRKHTWDSWRTAGLSGGLRTWSWMPDELAKVNSPTLAWIAGPPAAYTAQDHHVSAGQKFQKQIVLINDTRRPRNFTATWTATVNGQPVGGGELHGGLALSEIRKIPVEITAPRVEAGGEADGQITLTATIGQASHQDAFAFRVFGPDPSSRGQLAMVDPDGLTSRMLAKLGYAPRAWQDAAAPLVIIGRNGLKDDPAAAARLEPYVRAGGRALIFAQDPQWITQALEWRVCPLVSRYVFPVPHSPVSRGMDAGDLRDWTGSSTLLPAYPEYAGDYLRGNWDDEPYAGWHWGNRGGVASAAIEKPHRSGWTPLLECEFDLAYTPLMELNCGKGRLIVCTLDLEDHVALDPAARRMAGRVLDYALHSPLAPRAGKVVYLGDAAGQAWLDEIGVSYERSDTLDTSAGLLLIGPDATADPAALNAYLEAGGKAFFLPRTQADGWLGTSLKPAGDQFAGSRSAPDWPEARGLSASDLHWRCYLDTAPWILSGGADIGADGLLGRKTAGKGVAIFCQVDPDCFHADDKTYFRYTRWRSTRAVAQLLANLGASFAVDDRIFHPHNTAIRPDRLWIASDGDRAGHKCKPHPPAGVQLTASTMPEGIPTGYYCPDYRTDFPMGDNPYRYWRW